MTKQIEGIPEGWEFVGIRKAKKGEFSVAGNVPKPKAWDFDSESVYPIIRKLPEPLKVEAGKFYRQVDGRIVGPMRKAAGGDYPFVYATMQWNETGVRWDSSRRATTNLVSEVPENEVYRPFANAAEFKPHRDKWIIKNEGDGTGCWKAFSYSDEGVMTSVGRRTPYADLLKWKFEDGTPCGVKQ